MTQQNLTIGFSPCPNDTFIFDALIHDKIDTEGLSFEPQLLDVEALNEKALNTQLDITKLSYHAYAYVSQNYQLLTAGSALGKGCGPLLIAKNKKQKRAIENGKIAIPGKMTTANLLFKLEYSNAKNTVPMVFSDIEESVLNGKSDLGVIIHENRFTYQNKGLVKILDLGEAWEQKTECPIPLGGITIKRNLSNDIKTKVNRLIRKSIEFAFKNPSEPIKYMKQHAQEMDEQVMQQHVELYVNNFSIDVGEEGKKAVDLLFKKGSDLGLFNKIVEPYWVI